MASAVDDEETENEEEDDDEDDMTRGRGPKWLGEFIGANQTDPNAFQNFVIVLIMLNTVVMSFEADMPDKKWLWTIVDNVFLTCFSVELTMRLCFWGCRFFYNQDWKWNCFDFFIVGLGIADQWVMILYLKFIVGGDAHEHHQSGSLSRLVMMMRSIRILRVLRAIRLLRQFPDLYRLVMGLVGSFNSVVWVAVLFLMLLLVSSIFVTNIVGGYIDEFADPGAVKEYFGSMMVTMNTLFVYLTSDDWSTSARMVNEEMPFMEFFWIGYMFLGAFTLLSLLTGLMADKMNSVREEAEDLMEEDNEAKGEGEIEIVIKKYLSEPDMQRGDDRMSREGFEETFANGEFKKELLKIDAMKKLELDPCEFPIVYRAMRAQQAAFIDVGSEVKYIGPVDRLERYGLQKRGKRDASGDMVYTGKVTGTKDAKPNNGSPSSELDALTDDTLILTEEQIEDAKDAKKESNKFVHMVDFDGAPVEIEHQFLQEIGDNVSVKVVIKGLLAMASPDIETKPIVFAEGTLDKVDRLLSKMEEEEKKSSPASQDDDGLDWAHRVAELLTRATALKDKVYNIQQDVHDIMRDKGYRPKTDEEKEKERRKTIQKD